MFTVGEFSTLAQVSKRLLRYYDEIGLLIPVEVDPVTRYRYYSAEQMLDLNRILALKELGLSLDQIRQMLANEVSTKEMQGMLLLKRAEAEQTMQAELKRLRNIESRLQAIRNVETKQPLNVVIKEAPAQSVLNVRTIVDSFEEGLEIFSQIRQALPEDKYGLLYCICHNGDYVDYDLDLEMGAIVDMKQHAPVQLNGDLQLCPGELPAAKTMATIVVKGALETIHTGYIEIGLWAENTGYHPAGIPRELTLQMASEADGSDLITEIQFPVEPVGKEF